MVWQIYLYKKWLAVMVFAFCGKYFEGCRSVKISLVSLATHVWIRVSFIINEKLI